MTSRVLVSLALSLAWLAAAAGQGPPADEKDPIVGRETRLSKLVEKYNAAKTPEERFVVVASMLSNRLDFSDKVVAPHLPKAAVPFLVKALKDARIWDVALKNTLDPDLPKTIDFVSHLSFPYAIAGAFGEMGTDEKLAVAKAAVPALTKVMKDRDADICIRHKAAFLLIVVDKKSNGVALPVLLKQLDQNWQHRSDLALVTLPNAMDYLEALGPAAKDAIPALLVALVSGAKLPCSQGV